MNAAWQWVKTEDSNAPTVKKQQLWFYIGSFNTHAGPCFPINRSRRGWSLTENSFHGHFHLKNDRSRRDASCFPLWLVVWAGAASDKTLDLWIFSLARSSLLFLGRQLCHVVSSQRKCFPAQLRESATKTKSTKGFIPTSNKNGGHAITGF